MRKIILTLALVMAMSATAFADTTIGDWAAVKDTDEYKGTQAATATVGRSANGIVYTRHNLSSYGEHYQATTSVNVGNTALTVATTEVCVFCHTPHFSRAKNEIGPIWNRGSAAVPYQAYGNTKIADTPINTVGGASLACLSCHDGVTTIDNLINRPGKGVSPAVLSASGNATGAGGDMGWMFGEIGTDTIGGTNTQSRLRIGTDLSDDHPISVVYNPSVASLRPATTLISSLQILNAKTNTQGLSYGRSDNLWAAKGYISNSAQISDLLRDGNQVQCASCHDPHYKNQTNTDPSVVMSWSPTGVDPTFTIDDKDSDGLFLRRVGGNSNSGVCRTCHNK